jgi:flavodoxin-like protein
MNQPNESPHELRALVVFESMFGNTEAVARAIAEGLAPTMQVAVHDVNEAPTDLSDVDLLVAGGPTHALGMSRRRTRGSAEEQGARPAAAAGAGIRDWLGKVATKGRIDAAAFDTRIGHPRVPGSAARGIQRLMRRRGLAMVCRPVSFWVDGTPGPLGDGELGRAELWGHELSVLTQGVAGIRHSSTVPRG